MNSFRQAPLDDLDNQPARFVWQDDRGAEAIARPVVVRGRLADPAKIDEVVVTPQYRQ